MAAVSSRSRSRASRGAPRSEPRSLAASRWRTDGRRPRARSGRRGRAPSARAAARRSRNEQHLARRLAALERAVRLRGVLERELEFHAQLQLALADPAEQLAGALLQLLARGDVVEQARAREEERALGVEDLRIDHADGAARLAVQRDHAADRAGVEAALPRVLANGVVDDVHAL